MTYSTNGHGPSVVVDELDGLVSQSGGLDLATPSTTDTPRRFLRAIYDATDGSEGDPKLLTAFPTGLRTGGSSRE